MYRVLAALHGMDVVTMQTQLVSPKKTTEKEQPSFAARVEAQDLKSLDLDLREIVHRQGTHRPAGPANERADGTQAAFEGAKTGVRHEAQGNGRREDDRFA